jgi:short-subunit dehydrogenase
MIFIPIRSREKNILVTGGTTGTGKATALLLARNSVNLLIVGLEEIHLEKQSPTFGQVAEARVYGILAE